MKPLVIAACRAGSGIGNRIKCLMSAMRVADIKGAQLAVYWAENKALGLSLRECFSYSFLELSEDEFQSATTSGATVINTWRLWPAPEDKIGRDFSHLYPSPTGAHIDLEYERIPGLVRERYLSYFDQLTPTEKVGSLVHEIHARLGSDVIGMGLRTWFDHPQRAELFDEKAVRSVIESTPAKPFLVVSDDAGLLERLVKDYPERVHSCASVLKETHQELLTDRGLRTLVELYALSKCRRMHVTFGSTFSEVAWWLGGCIAEVVQIPNKCYLMKAIDCGEHVGICVFHNWKFYTKNRLNMLIIKAVGWSKYGFDK